MPLRVSFDQVNRYVLGKQHLGPGARARDVLSLVRDIGPVRATPSASMYLSLWARIQDLEKKQLDEALYDERSLVRIPAMHARLYLIPAEDLVAYYQASKSLLKIGLDDLDDILYKGDGHGDGTGHTSSRQMAHRVLEVMSTIGPATIDELADLLPELQTEILHDPDLPELGGSRLGTRLVPAMCADGLLIRARTRGGWRSDLFRYATLAAWLPTVDLDQLDPADALSQVIRAYVRAFGPVTVGDVLHWLGGHTRREVVSALMSMADLTRIQIAGSYGDYLILEEQLPDLLSDEEAEPSVCLLPPRDSYPMAYSDPERFIASPFVERVFDRVGESLGTVWVDGQIAGSWRLQLREERVVIRFFERMGPQPMALVGEEARRLADFVGFDEPQLDIATDQDDLEQTDEVPVLIRLRTEGWAVSEGESV